MLLVCGPVERFMLRALTCSTASSFASPSGTSQSGPPPSTPSISMLRRCGVHIYAFGRADLGQLCVANGEHLLSPVLIEALEGKDAVHISANAYNTAIATRVSSVQHPGSEQLPFHSAACLSCAPPPPL